MTQTPTCLGLHIGHDRGITIVQNEKIAFHIAVEGLIETNIRIRPIFQSRPFDRFSKDSPLLPAKLMR